MTSCIYAIKPKKHNLIHSVGIDVIQNMLLFSGIAIDDYPEIHQIPISSKDVLDFLDVVYVGDQFSSVGMKVVDVKKDPHFTTMFLLVETPTLENCIFGNRHLVISMHETGSYIPREQSKVYNRVFGENNVSR